MLNAQSVSELNRQIGALLESTFLHVRVEGEVSRAVYHTSGHLYFTLKDENSSISCAMFRGNLSKIKFKIEDGMKIIVSGSINVYAPKGTYNINIIHTEPSGVGALTLAYQQLKDKLSKKGYFNDKKQMPKIPKHISIVTSPTGAVLQDMLNVIKKRWPLLKITLVPTVVQGENAKFEIANAIKFADSLKSDIMIIARGGGSVEDLWAFNEEIVADALYLAKTPTVSAIGHEIDTVISDFVADLRAPTPSAAMELVLPDKNEFLQNIDFLMTYFNDKIKKVITKKSEQLNNFFDLYKQNSYDVKLELQSLKLSNLITVFNEKYTQMLEAKKSYIKLTKESLNLKIHHQLGLRENYLSNLKNMYAIKEPTKESRFGYAQIIKDGKKISLEKIKKNEEFELQSPKTKIIAKALKIEKL